jgi:hypothetical protein
MPLRVIRAVLLACLLVGSPAVYAATYTVAPKFVAAYAYDGLFTELTDYDLSSGDPALLQIEFEVSFGGFTPPAAGYSSGEFAISLDGLSNTTAPGWMSYTSPIVDTNGAIPGGMQPLFGEIREFGLGNLQNIVVSVALAGLSTDPAVDPRFNAAQDAPVAIGSAYLDFPGGAGTVTAAFKQVFYLGPHATQAGRYIHVKDLNPTLVVSSLRIGVPEPTSAAAAVIGLLAVGWRSRE